MSRFRNEVAHLQSHVRTLRVATGAAAAIAFLLGAGWWSAPRNLTIHVPPDLRSGSTRKWWEVPPESVYAFTFYVWQQLHRWPTNGEDDYARNIRSLAPYFTPACTAFLEQDLRTRHERSELRQRVRGVYEIPGRGYGDDPATRVKTLSPRDWLVTLDLIVDEYYGAEQVKRAFVRYPLKAVRLDVDAEKNPFGLAIDCFAGSPQRIALPDLNVPAATGTPMRNAGETAP